MGDEYLTVEELLQRKEFAHLKPETLRKWRQAGFGPPCTVIGRKPFYRLSGVMEWVRSRERGGEETKDDVRRNIGPLPLPTYTEPQKSPRKRRLGGYKTREQKRRELEAQKRLESGVDSHKL